MAHNTKRRNLKKKIQLNQNYKDFNSISLLCAFQQNFSNLTSTVVKRNNALYIIIPNDIIYDV